MATASEDRKLQILRINITAGIVVLLILVLFARLWYLQIAMGDNLLMESESNRIKLLRVRAPRGTIIDGQNKVLATSRPQFVVLAIPEQLESVPEAMHTLCGILQISPEQLKEIEEKGKTRPGSPVRVAIDVPLETVARIGELRMKLPGVSVEQDYVRNYPDGPSVSHVVGYLGEISQNQLDESEDYKLGDYVGKAGLEKEYEEDLRGKDGGKRIEVNAFGRVMRILGDKPNVPGAVLKLSIRKDLQIAAHRALGSRVGAAVAIDPRTGAVLTMVSSPQYDPNIFVKKLNPADWNKIIKNKGLPLQNRCIGNVYPPGSTFKPIIAVAGLKYNVCNSGTSTYCPGFFHLGRYRKGCWKAHGPVAFVKAISESCDVWFYKMSLKLGIDNMARVAKQFGIGSPTHIDLPGEPVRKSGRFGTMPDPAWKKRVYDERWYKGDTLNTSIGQGYVEASPLQMAMSCAAVANGGKVYKPYLVAEKSKPGKGVFSKTKPQILSTVDAPAEYFDLVRNAMRTTVTSGTGRVCDIPGVAVAGKTGSAEARGPAHAWFICFAPVENPQIAIAVIVEHGKHGASAAAPVCRAIMDVYFGKKKPQQINASKASVSGD